MSDTRFLVRGTRKTLFRVWFGGTWVGQVGLRHPPAKGISGGADAPTSPNSGSATEINTEILAR